MLKFATNGSMKGYEKYGDFVIWVKHWWFCGGVGVTYEENGDFVIWLKHWWFNGKLNGKINGDLVNERLDLIISSTRSRASRELLKFEIIN